MSRATTSVVDDEVGDQMTTMTELVTWVDVCRFDDLVPDRGVAALVGAWQIAVFRLAPDDPLFAVSNFDPYSNAYVLSRGIVGTAGTVRKVASPMYKHCFDLATGQSLDDPETTIRTFPVRLVCGRVEVGVTPERQGGGS